MSVDVALVTCAELASTPDPDDAFLRDALVARGKSVAIVPWSDAKFEWRGAGLVLLRSTWDYHLRRDEFLAWVDRTAKLTRFHNPPDVVRWNSHKSYLNELAAKGLPVVPTELVKKGSKPDLDRMMSERKWKKVVIKPAVSGGSYRTMLADAAKMAEARPHLDLIVSEGDALVQPYLPVVEGYGERSMIMIEGELSHAIRKRPAFGKQGGGVAAAFKPGEPLLENADVDPAVAAEDEVEAAQEILRGAGADGLLYARVDLVRETDGRPVLMELELVEPSLFLGPSHGGEKARAAVCDAIIRRLAAPRGAR